VLVGGKGHDTLNGGRGNDRIFARDGVRDHINCGSGNDSVRADRADVVARNCEHVSR
jgi:Ca2+-binding RTX toxin-like protein